MVKCCGRRGDPLVGIHLNHDEINGVARDRRSLLSNLTNGELLMRSINNLTSIITAKQPGITPFVYDDMFNPWQLCKCYQVHLGSAAPAR